MGRQRTYSDTERQQRQRKLNQGTAQKRKKLYRKDATYREFAKGSSRATYRRQRGLSLRNLRNAHEFLDTLETLGTVRELHDAEAQLTFSVRELSVALGGYHPNVIRQWCRDGKFPPPKLSAVCKGKELVYSLPQARALLEVIGEHQTAKAYLSTNDKDTIKRLFAAMHPSDSAAA